MLCSLVTDGVCGGVGAVIGFLPTIVTLFFFLSILEDSGYMARVAFVMDKPLRRLGLSGRSFVPMLMGFGCSVPAIMSARTLSSERDRKMTILLVPFMSCSAKLPIYGFIAAALFEPAARGWVVLSLYLLGMVVGVLYALALKRLEFHGEPVPFVMELPNYRLPSAKSVARLVWIRQKGFIQKAFTVVFIATLVVWFLQTFDASLSVAESPDSSLLAGHRRRACASVRAVGLWRLARIDGFAHGLYGERRRRVYAHGAAWRRCKLAAHDFHARDGICVPRVYAAVHAVRCGYRHGEKETNGRTAAKLVVAQCAVAWVVAFCIHAGCLAFGIV